MKKNMLIILSILLTFTSILAMDIEIGNGTTTTNFMPLSGFYGYSWSNFIIDSDLIGMDVEIDQVQFNVSNTPVNVTTANQKLYIKNTTATTVTAAYPNPETAGFTLVFDGSVTWNGGGWQGIMLDTPYEYNGTDNLQLVWENHSGTYDTNYPKFYCTEVETTVGAHKHQDSGFPVTDGTSVTFFPNIKISFEAANAPTVATLVAPANEATGLLQQ